MEPPCPPSPPLGPPRGTRFSRRKARHPRPPLPAVTWMSTSSTNNFYSGEPLGVLFNREDTDDPAACAVVLESYPAGGGGEDRVVLAEPCVEAGPEAAPALPHDDGAAGDDVAVVRLDAEPLRIGIAAVPGAALSFFMCHDLTLQKDIGNPHPGVCRAMPLGPAHTLAALLLEDADLGSAAFTLDHADDARVRDEGSAREHLAAVLFDEQHVREGGSAPGCPSRAGEDGVPD